MPFMIEVAAVLAGAVEVKEEEEQDTSIRKLALWRVLVDVLVDVRFFFGHFHV